MRHKFHAILKAGVLSLFLIFVALTSLALANPGIAQFKFSGPITDADRLYLGLEKPGPFRLQDIKTPYILIEIMRTTCPHCLEQVPALNQLYHLVAKSDLKDKIKFVSLGESDHESGLKRFKAAYKVPFPMVPDPDWGIANVIKLEGTPTTIVVDRHGKVLLTEVGVFDSAGQMFKRLKTRLK